MGDNLSRVSSECEFAVVIVSYNSRQLIKNAIDSILHGQDANCEIVVVDNASGDNTADLVESEYPQVTLIRNTQNVGFATATNQGVMATEAPKILLLNPDASLKPYAIRILADHLDKNPGTGIVAPKLLNPDGTLQKSCRSFPNIINMTCRCIFPPMKPFTDKKPDGKCADFWEHDKSAFVDFVMGACMMFRRSEYIKLGGFDSEYFLYGEEKDFAYRMRKIGLLCYYEKNAEAFHLGGQSSKTYKPSMALLYKSHTRFINLHYGTVERASIKLILFIGALFRFLWGVCMRRPNSTVWLKGCLFVLKTDGRK